MGKFGFPLIPLSKVMRKRMKIDNTLESIQSGILWELKQLIN